MQKPETKEQALDNMLAEYAGNPSVHPVFTHEVDLRPWQGGGEDGSSIHLIAMGPERWRIFFVPQPENVSYLSEIVKEVAQFGKNKSFSILEGKYGRYFVDFTQCKCIGTEYATDFEQESYPLHLWSPTIEQYRTWRKTYDKMQSHREENVLARFPPPAPSTSWFSFPWFS